MKKYIDILMEKGAAAALEIAASSIVTAPWTVYKCRYGCDTYGKSHMCPPNTPTWKETQEMIDRYDKAILFMCHDGSLVTSLAVDVAKTIFSDDYYKAIAFGSGPCKICKECDPDHCNFPGRSVPSMEACGIDVFATVRNNGMEIHTLKDDKQIPTHFGLILVE